MRAGSRMTAREEPRRRSKGREKRARENTRHEVDNGVTRRALTSP